MIIVFKKSISLDAFLITYFKYYFLNNSECVPSL